MMSHRTLVAVLAVGLGAGCAGVSPAHVGQTAGTIAGSAIAPGVGGPIGSLVGLMAGLLVQGQVDKVTEKRERKELGDQMATGAPASAPTQDALPSGTPTRVWVDETMQHGRLAAGHFDVRQLP
jgi:hypothetical protein